MKTLLWKIKYTLEVRKLLGVSLRMGWDMAGSTVESFASDIADGSLTPKEAAENERNEWANSCC